MEHEDLAEQHKEIKQDIDNIRDIVHNIQLIKQDKISLTWVLGTFGSVLVLSLSVAFWFGTSLSSLDSEIKTLSKLLETGTADRYTATTAIRDFTLRDRHLDYLERRLTIAEANCEAHRASPGHQGSIAELKSLKEKIQDCCDKRTQP